MHARVLWFCWLGWVFDLYDLLLFVFVKPQVAAELTLDITALGWIDGWTLFATAVGGFAFAPDGGRAPHWDGYSAADLVRW